MSFIFSEKKSDLTHETLQISKKLIRNHDCLIIKICEAFDYRILKLYRTTKFGFNEYKEVE